MGAGGSGMPGPTLFLLLVLPPSLVSKKSFLHSVPGSRDFQHLSLSWESLHRHLIQDRGNFRHHRSLGAWQVQTKETFICANDFYFVLDKSGSVGNNWIHVYNLVEELVKKLENPKQRISFITYSTQGQIDMMLTSDRKAIQDGLSSLRNIVPTGATDMQEGLELAIEQIEKEKSRGSKNPVIIIALTDGTLLNLAFEETKKVAEKARKLGAVIYAVGVNDYKREQLNQIADSKNHVFGVDTGFEDLMKIADTLSRTTCVEITSAIPSSFCANENYDLKVSGRGFNNARNKNEVICRFTFSDKKFFDKKATSVQDTILMCPGIKTEYPGQKVFIEVSLNNGISFINNDIEIISEECTTTVPTTTTTPAPTTTRKPTTTRRRTTTRRTTTTTTQPPPRPPPAPPPPPPPPPDPPPGPPPAPPSAPPPDPPPDPTPDPTTDMPPDKRTAPPPATQFMHIANPLYLLTLIPAMLMFPLLFCCIWRLCFKKTFKEPTPVQIPEREPETRPIQTCPTVIVPCCGCQEDSMQRMEDKLDILCDFVQNYNQVPLMCCQPWDKGRCMDVSLVNPHCTQMPYGPMACLGPSQDYLSLNSCCSWCQHRPQICSQLPSRMMLPLIPPTARALCRTTLSLPSHRQPLKH
ncbi:anthrax toxin receptor-like [Myotis yumanensis]|uniref:anthrax toxin receptor-like n=1 Tax=Myotis yumanensis TaxID=159337 RepID=UPI0038D3D486